MTTRAGDPAAVQAEPLWQRVEREGGRLARQAVQRMESLPWFVQLPAAERSTVGLVVQAGVLAFTAWLRDPTVSPPGMEVFAAAPRELARSVSLKETVQLIRIAVAVFEEEVPKLAPSGQADALTAQVLRYSREIGFGAAEVYAAAAESRGAWDARLEASVVEALVRDQVGELTLSRAGSLGWGPVDWVVPLAAPMPGPVPERVTQLRVDARSCGWSVLMGEAGGALLVIVGGLRGEGRAAPLVQMSALVADALPDGAVVQGPVVPDLAAAAGATRETLSALAAVAAWPAAPRPVPASELLAERAVLGDEAARRRLLEEVYKPLAATGGELLATVASYVEGGGSIEGTGRTLFLHANTVRYRLRKVADTSGLDVTRPRDAQLIRVALVLGRVHGGVTER
ncbi:MAG: PucR family transcriptional regulator [Frankiales bacterium]|nr:PucR family transcriptional regulator [Frankiales bacterium]